MKEKTMSSLKSKNADKSYINNLYLEYNQKIDEICNTKKNKKIIKEKIEEILEAFLLLLPVDIRSNEKGEAATRSLRIKKNESYLKNLLRSIIRKGQSNKKIKKAIAITGLTEFKIGDQIDKAIIEKVMETSFHNC